MSTFLGHLLKIIYAAILIHLLVVVFCQYINIYYNNKYNIFSTKHIWVTQISKWQQSQNSHNIHDYHPAFTTDIQDTGQSNPHKLLC